MRTGLNLSVVIADKSGLENPSNLSTNTFATHNAVKWVGPLGGGALFIALIPHRERKQKRPCDGGPFLHRVWDALPSFAVRNSLPASVR